MLQFWPNHKWDLKGQIGIPPNGGWALYHGELVNNQYLANNAYAQAMASLGFSSNEAKDVAESFTHVNTAWQKKKIENDQPEDQAAIESGWLEYQTGEPWPPSVKKPIDFLH